MKLTEISGTLYRVNSAEHCLDTVQTVAEADVLYFQCPKCAVGLKPGEENGRRFFEGAHYISVPFAAHDGRPAYPDDQSSNGNKPRWSVTGKTLEDIATFPSILVIGGCAWHGYVRNGDAS